MHIPSKSLLSGNQTTLIEHALYRKVFSLIKSA